jgi:hypothetical protein
MVLLPGAQEEPDASQCRAARQRLLGEAEQDHRLHAEERGADQRGDLPRRERAQVAEARCRLRCRLLEEVDPATDVGAHGGGDLVVAPPGGGHLLEHAHVPRAKVVFEEVARLVPLLPQRHLGAIETTLPSQELLVLLGQHRQHQVLTGPEVIVDLAERDPCPLGHAPGRQAAIASVEQGGLGGAQDLGPGLVDSGRHHHPVRSVVRIRPQAIQAGQVVLFSVPEHKAFSQARSLFPYSVDRPNGASLVDADGS